MYLRLTYILSTMYNRFRIRRGGTRAPGPEDHLYTVQNIFLMHFTDVSKIFNKKCSYHENCLNEYSQ